MAQRQEWPRDDLIREFIQLKKRLIALETVSRGSEWYDYTVAWSSTGTQPSFGSAVPHARYMRVGYGVHVQIRFTFAGDSTYGSGAWLFSIPFAAKYPATSIVVGSAMIYDLSAAGGISGTTLADGAFSGQFSCWFGGPTVGTGSIAQGTPITFVSGDQVMMDAFYESSE